MELECAAKQPKNDGKADRTGRIHKEIPGHLGRPADLLRVHPCAVMPVAVVEPDQGVVLESRGR
jgi:hypothetical protein